MHHAFGDCTLCVRAALDTSIPISGLHQWAVDLHIMACTPWVVTVLLGDRQPQMSLVPSYTTGFERPGPTLESLLPNSKLRR